MNLKSLIGVLGVLLPIFKAMGQEIKPLNIGDTMPDISFNSIVNYKSPTAKLSDFKGKLVILDFFATWCGSCINALPHLDSLQKQFTDSIQIFVVSNEPEEKIRQFVQTSKKAKNISLPFLYDDTVLSSQLFPHKTIPHEVVLDNRQAVRAITYAEYINYNNIRHFLASGIFDAPCKNDLLHFDQHKPLLQNGAFNDRIICNSLLTSYIEGLGSQTGNTVNEDGTHKIIYYLNRPLLALYLRAAHITEGNRILLESNTLSRYINPSANWNEWARNNSYCYEITAPLLMPDSTICHFMLQDLNRYLGINARKEKRKITCWALINNSAGKKYFITQGGEPLEKLQDKDTSYLYLKNKPLSRLVEALNSQLPGKPLHPIVLDETGITGNVDLELQLNDIQNLPATAKELRRYGLDIIPVVRELEILVITDSAYK